MAEDSKKEVTIYDIARELKVSASTVSRALSGHPGIGKKTRKAVEILAKELNYRPNAFAASLRTKRSNTIGILVPWINRPFISSLISGVENAASEAGYQVIISQSHDSFQMESENARALFESRISALIVSLAMETGSYDHFNIFSDSGIPVVYVDRIPQMKSINKVHINNFRAAFEATEHLVGQGCKRIAHFGGASDQVIYENRRLGYQSAIQKHGLDMEAELNIRANYLSSEEGMRLSEKILSGPNPPDGLFCANDTSAVSAIQFAKKIGLRVPEDLAIIGFNNDPICTMIDPPLSSVDHPAIQMGKVAVSRALDLLEGPNASLDSCHNTLLETNLIIRQSSDRSEHFKSDSK